MAIANSPSARRNLGLHARHDAAHGARAEARDEERKAEGETRGQRDIQVVDRALGHTADHREHDQAKDVVYHGRGQDDAARAHVQQAARRQHLGGNSDAGGDHRRAGEDAFQPRFAPERTDSPSGEEGHDRLPPTATSNAVPPTFINSEAFTSSPTRKSRNITPRSESVRQEFGGGEPAKHLRTDQYARENFSDDARLSEALEDFRQKLGRREDQEHRERDLGEPTDMSPLWNAARLVDQALEWAQRTREWKWAGRRRPRSPG